MSRSHWSVFGGSSVTDKSDTCFTDVVSALSACTKLSRTWYQFVPQQLWVISKSYVIRYPFISSVMLLSIFRKIWSVRYVYISVKKFFYFLIVLYLRWRISVYSIYCLLAVNDCFFSGSVLESTLRHVGLQRSVYRSYWICFCKVAKVVRETDRENLLHRSQGFTGRPVRDGTPLEKTRPVLTVWISFR